MNMENMGQELEALTNEIESAISNESLSVQELQALRVKALGYKPRGILREMRHLLYTAQNACEKRSAEKKEYGQKIKNLASLEDKFAEQLDGAIASARVRAKARKEEVEAVEQTPENM
jgi:hypothetical protein